MREDLAHRLAEADVLLMTSQFEGAPRILAEALGCGTPVAGPRSIDPAAAISSSNGCLTESRDAESIAEAILAAAALDRRLVSESVRRMRAKVLVPELLGQLDQGRRSPGGGEGSQGLARW
jgi:glycosyltransferase involved in cell wall biosynthesis